MASTPGTTHKTQTTNQPPNLRRTHLHPLTHERDLAHHQRPLGDPLPGSFRAPKASIVRELIGLLKQHQPTEQTNEKNEQKEQKEHKEQKEQKEQKELQNRLDSVSYRKHGIYLILRYRRVKQTRERDPLRRLYEDGNFGVERQMPPVGVSPGPSWWVGREW